MSAADVVRMFHEARDPDYRELAGRYRKVLHPLDRKSAARSAHIRRAWPSLRRTSSRWGSSNFFDAPGRAEVERLQEATDMRRRPTENPRRRETPALDLRALRGAAGSRARVPSWPA